MVEIFNVPNYLQELDKIDTKDAIFFVKCAEAANAICQKKTTVRDVVTELGFLLVHVLPEKREKGTLILSLILKNLSYDILTSSELQFISAFYADRLKDHHQVIPAVLKGILAVSQMKNVPSESPRILLNALFDNIPCQQQQLIDRQCIYYILQEFLNNNVQEIQAMGLDFVLGVISAMDGERDPRNLLLLFNWLPQMLRSVSLSHLAEEMFDVISCYFPVDFRAPSQDPEFVSGLILQIRANVTREDLAKALCPCMSAVPEFAEFCVPLLLEKLNSSLKIAKLDSLNLLTESCKTFNTSIYETHSEELCSALQKEILNSSDSELENASLLAMTAVVECMSKSENNAIFKRTLNNLYDTLRGNLRPDTKLFIPSSKILLAIARASSVTCNDVIKLTVPLMINQYNITTNVNHQELIFKTLLMNVLVYIKMFDVSNIMEVELLHEIPTLCLEAIIHREPEIRIASLEHIALMAKTFPLNIREHLYAILKTNIVQLESQSVRLAILKCFKSIAQIYSSEILEKIILHNSITENGIVLQLYLEALCVIIPEKEFTSKILPQLLNYCFSENILVSIVAFKCLRKLIEDNVHSNEIQNYLFVNCEVVKKCLDWALNVINNDDESNYNLVQDVSTILKLIIGYQDSNEQEIIIKTHLTELLEHYKSNGSVQYQIIVILEGFLAKLRNDVQIPDKYNMLKKLLTSTVHMQTSNYLYVCRLTANIVNKCETDQLQVFLDDTSSYITSVLYNNSASTLEIQNMILLISWMTKALVLRGWSQAEIWIDKLILLLDTREDVAKSFKLIMEDCTTCLNKECYCNIRFLYRQKFFSYVTNKLSKTYKLEKPNHLVAMGYLLQQTPQQIIKMYFQEILQLLTFSLDYCKSSEALCAVLETLCSAIKTKEPYIENHIEDLLPRFLKLTKYEPSMRVRIEAIRCIQEFSTGYPTYKLLPLKHSIIFGLEPCLDDGKRLVRRQAVEARSSWFLFDAPT